MTIRKCLRCNLKSNEGSASFYKRFDKGLKNNPFICLACIKIKFLIDNPHIAIERQQKHEEKINRNRLMKKSIKDFTNNQFVKIGIIENNEKRKKNFRKYLDAENGKAAYRNSMTKRRANIFNALINLTKEELKIIKNFYKFCPEGFHVDHIIPLSKGGKHCGENLQYLKAEDNLKKSNKLTYECLEMFLENGEQMSISFLQRKFKLQFSDAEMIMKELGLLDKEKTLDVKTTSGLG